MATSKSEYASRGWRNEVLDSLVLYKKHPEVLKGAQDRLDNAPRWVQVKDRERVQNLINRYREEVGG